MEGSSSKKDGNYFVRHWRGDLSLPVAYWINFVLVGVVPIVLQQTVLMRMRETGQTLRLISIADIGFILLAILTWLWAVVGVWRSADLHVARGGTTFWATTAKVVVVLSAITTIGVIVDNVIPRVREDYRIAFGRDPVGEIVLELSSDGTAIIVKGALREGSAGKFEELLAAAPHVKSIVLHLDGGRTLEAERIAKAVQRRSLNTHVGSQCNSACTFVLLAGVERTAESNAKIGFHQLTYPGLAAEQRAFMDQEMAALYRKANLPEDFIERIRRTSSDDIWYPTRDELIAANVLTNPFLAVDSRGAPEAAQTAALARMRAMAAVGEELKVMQLKCTYEYATRRDGSRVAMGGEDWISVSHYDQGQDAIINSSSESDPTLYGRVTNELIVGSRAAEFDEGERKSTAKQVLNINRYTGAFHKTRIIDGVVISEWHGTCRAAPQKLF